MLTKQDLLEIAEILNKSDLKDSIDKLTASNTDLLNKVDAVDKKVSALEDKFTGETSEIRSELELLANFGKSLENTVAQYKSEADNAILKLREEVKQLNDEGHKKLEKKVERLENSVHSGQQHDRLWNIEIVGIPANVGYEPDQLQDAALAIFEAINVTCGPENIEAIHRLKSNERSRVPATILCIDNRRIIRDIHKNKHKLKNLKDLNIDIAGLTEDSKLFINPSLTPYTRSLAYNCRLLRNDRLIEKVRVEDDGAVKIKFFGKDNYERIRFESDLNRLFPDYKEFSFDQ